MQGGVQFFVWSDADMVWVTRPRPDSWFKRALAAVRVSAKRATTRFSVRGMDAVGATSENTRVTTPSTIPTAETSVARIVGISSGATTGRGEAGDAAFLVISGSEQFSFQDGHLVHRESIP